MTTNKVEKVSGQKTLKRKLYGMLHKHVPVIIIFSSSLRLLLPTHIVWLSAVHKNVNQLTKGSLRSTIIFGLEEQSTEHCGWVCMLCFVKLINVRKIYKTKFNFLETYLQNNTTTGSLICFIVWMSYHKHNILYYMRYQSTKFHNALLTKLKLSLSMITFYIAKYHQKLRNLYSYWNTSDAIQMYRQ